MHDAASSKARRDARRDGGKARSHQARARAALPAAMESAETAVWLSIAFKQVLAGEREPKVGTARATMAKALLEVQAAAELEQRLAALEAEVRRERRSA